MLTLEERERRAYIEGRVEEAQLLTLAIDGEDNEIDHLKGRIEDLESEVERLEATLYGEDDDA